MYGILRLCSKRFQNEIKIMKYLNILDLLYFIIIMCCFVLVSGAGRNKNGEYLRFLFHFENVSSTNVKSHTFTMYLKPHIYVSITKKLGLPVIQLADSIYGQAITIYIFL